MVILRRGCALLAVLAVVACNTDGPPASPGSSGPAMTSAPAGTPALALVGPAETVFDWSEDACDGQDIPDLPARAFRDADGNVQVITSHFVSRRFIGATLDDIARDCRPVMRSPMDADPSRYSDRSWLAAPYTEDGQAVYALVHNEYHGHEHAGRCPPGEYFPCWYNSITSAISTDAGRSYSPPAPPPEHLVASLPNRYEPGAGPYGVFEPSNIIQGPDGAYYAYVRVDEYRSDQQRICLLRAASLGADSVWRAWDGAGFTLELGSPYLDDERPDRACAGIDPDRLGVMGSSITFNTYLNQYVMVGATATQVDGREVWGVLYSFSDDLVTWQPRRLLVEVELPWTYQPGDANVYLYPALLDPASESRNFETTGATAFLYLTRFNTRESGDTIDTLDRDLVRIPVKFFPTIAAAEAAQVLFSP